MSQQTLAQGSPYAGGQPLLAAPSPGQTAPEGYILQPGFVYADQGAPAAQLIAPASYNHPENSGQNDIELSSCGSCGKSDCAGSCENCSTCGNQGCNRHSSAFYKRSAWGEFLFLRPRNAEVAYAVPVDGPINAPVVNTPQQIGRVGLVDPDFSAGFRVGFALDMGPTSSLAVQYTKFENSTQDATTINAPDVVFPLVVHPTTINAAITTTAANATMDIDFDLIDLEHRGLLSCGKNYTLSYFGGLRYGRLAQNFHAQYNFNQTTDVFTNMNFDGVGPRIGLYGESYGRHGFSFFARTEANFLAGQFSGNYLQQSTTNSLQAQADWKAGRIVSILELELGISWKDRCDRLRLRAGYMVSGWFNTVTTQRWVDAVQANEFDALSDTVTFDGFTARAEWLY